MRWGHRPRRQGDEALARKRDQDTSLWANTRTTAPSAAFSGVRRPVEGRLHEADHAQRRAVEEQKVITANKRHADRADQEEAVKIMRTLM